MEKLDQNCEFSSEQNIHDDFDNDNQDLAQIEKASQIAMHNYGKQKIKKQKTTLQNASHKATEEQLSIPDPHILKEDVDFDEYLKNQDQEKHSVRSDNSDVDFEEDKKMKFHNMLKKKTKKTHDDLN